MLLKQQALLLSQTSEAPLIRFRPSIRQLNARHGNWRLHPRNYIACSPVDGIDGLY
jgi:hypothetical protein